MRREDMPGRGRSAGFSLVSAVFVLVVLAAAGATMVRVSGVQRTTTTLALLGPRAYHAARSGLEWMTHRALEVPGSCPPGPVTTASFVLTEGGLQGYRVTVDCTSEVHDLAGRPHTRFTIASLAERGTYGDRDYVSRRLEVVVSDGS